MYLERVELLLTICVSIKSIVCPCILFKIMDIWTTIENDLCIQVPNHLKNALNFCGFGNPISIKLITSNAVDDVEKFVRQKLPGIILKHNKNVRDLKDYFGEVYAGDPTSFEIHFGERMLIEKIVEFVKNKDVTYFKTRVPNSTEVCDISDENKQTNYFLEMLQKTANRNSSFKPGGYSYGLEIKRFASYFRMICGKFAYETIQSNLQSAIPSISAVDKYIQASNCDVFEGVPRCNELQIYLKDNNLPLAVHISGDATRIVGRVEYDAKTNQIMGFVLPIKADNGLPIPFSYPAESADAILAHFSRENRVSSFVNVVMAQPLGNVTPFCLLVYGSDNRYSATNVADRWKTLKEKLATLNIQVLSISSDSDPKFNAAMRKLSLLGHSSNIIRHEWFSCGAKLDDTLFVQDPAHIGTKLRNLLLRTLWKKKSLPCGHFFIEIEHLITLMQTVPKDQHQLTPTTLNPTDRQNFSSVLRMCDPKVTILLKSRIACSQATVMFLELMRDIVDSFIISDMQPLERIRKMWQAVFLLRIWREHILSDKRYTLKDNFLSSNCYSCIELNAHSLVLMLLYLKQINSTEWCYIHLTGSQQCERFFRQIRSFTTVYSTVANCSVKEILNRIGKIHFQNITIQDTSNNFVYPRFNPGKRNQIYDLPSKSEIINVIEEARVNAVKIAQSLGMANKKNSYRLSCKISPYIAKKRSNKRIIPNSTTIITEQLTVAMLRNIRLKNYSNKYPHNEKSIYVEMKFEGGKQIVVKKSSLCWLLRQECQKLSTDRLLRVQTPIEPAHKADTKQRKKQSNLYRYKPMKTRYNFRINKTMH